MAEIVPVANTNEPSRTADVVFLHGWTGTLGSRGEPNGEEPISISTRSGRAGLARIFRRWAYGRSSTTLRFQSGRGPVCPSATGRPACSIF